MSKYRVVADGKGMNVNRESVGIFLLVDVVTGTAHKFSTSVKNNVLYKHLKMCAELGEEYTTKDFIL